MALGPGQDEVVGDLDITLALDQNSLNLLFLRLLVLIRAIRIRCMVLVHLFHFLILCYVVLRLRQIPQLCEGIRKRRAGLLLAVRHYTQRAHPHRLGLFEQCDGFLPFLVSERLLAAFEQVIKHVVLLRNVGADFSYFE